MLDSQILIETIIYFYIRYNTSDLDEITECMYWHFSINPERLTVL